MAFCNGPNYNFHINNGYLGLGAQETGQLPAANVFPMCSPGCTRCAARRQSRTSERLRTAPRGCAGYPSLKTASTSIECAEQLGGKATAAEKGLIQALKLRCAWPVPAEDEFAAKQVGV